MELREQEAAYNTHFAPENALPDLVKWSSRLVPYHLFFVTNNKKIFAPWRLCARHFGCGYAALVVKWLLLFEVIPFTSKLDIRWI